MTDPKYPRAWAHWADGIGFNGAICCTTREAADACKIEGDTTVELIPLPEHEAIVAAAVKAERERLMKMVTPLTVLQNVIREVPS